MSGYLEATIKAVRTADEQRPRSQQTQVGWSDVGGCRAALAYQLEDTWPSDEPDTWGAIRGTALHAPILTARAATMPHLLHEVPTSYRGVPGHADEVDPVENSVTDVKTTTLGVSIVWRRDPDALRAKRIQVHGYAAGLLEQGVLDPARPVIVRLIVAPVDGRFGDWWVHEEPYDQGLADEGIARLDDVKATLARGERPPRDEPYQWCQDWCDWFTLCRGDADPGEEVITDPQLAAAVEAYGQANTRAGAAKKEKDALAPLIRGLKGSARGWRVSMTSPSGTKEVPDMDRIRADYAHNERSLPTTEVPTSSPSLRVTKQKGQG